MTEPTPADRIAAQEVILKIWLARRFPRIGRRKGDLPLPELLTRTLSPSQIDRYAKWQGRQVA